MASQDQPTPENAAATGRTRTALIAGASGLVGGHLLDDLLDSLAYDKVISLGRRTLPLQHPKLEQHIVDFDRLPGGLQADDIFCCLGTTIKKAGSKEAFRKVDHDYPLALAKAMSHPDRQFLIVTALGADANSGIFYNKVKGEVEREVAAVPFSAVHIFRPSLLMGNRKELRIGERLAQWVSTVLPFIFIGPFRKYKPVPASMVAKAMLEAALDTTVGVHTHQSKDIIGQPA